MNLPVLMKEITIQTLLAVKKISQTIISIPPDAPAGLAVKLFETYNISQLPVLDQGKIMGTFRESSLIRLFESGTNINDSTVSSFMDPPLPSLDSKCLAIEAYELFKNGADALIITENSKPKNLITLLDIVHYFISNHGDFEILEFSIASDI